MGDYLIHNGTTRAGDSVDIVVRDGTIESVVDAGLADKHSFNPADRFDADGRLVTPTFSEPHTHLDSALTVDVAGTNESGTLESSGLEAGAAGSIVVHGGPNPFDVLRTREPRALVVKDGVPIAQSERTMRLTVDNNRTINPTNRAGSR